MTKKHNDAIDHRVYNLTVMICPAADLSGTWMSHVLELDTISQGANPVEAWFMAREAAEMVILDDLNAGRDPMLRSAPVECWRRHERATAGNPEHVDLRKVDGKNLTKMYVARIVMGFELASKTDNVVSMADFKKKKPPIDAVEMKRKQA